MVKIHSLSWPSGASFAAIRNGGQRLHGKRIMKAVQIDLLDVGFRPVCCALNMGR
jgi:hypothetical protein